MSISYANDLKTLSKCLKLKWPEQGNLNPYVQKLNFKSSNTEKQT